MWKFIPRFYCKCNGSYKPACHFPYPCTVFLQEEVDEECAVAMMWPEVFQGEGTDKNINLSTEENIDESKENYLKDENTNENKTDETGLTQVRVH